MHMLQDCVYINLLFVCLFSVDQWTGSDNSNEVFKLCNRMGRLMYEQSVRTTYTCICTCICIMYMYIYTCTFYITRQSMLINKVDLH